MTMSTFAIKCLEILDDYTTREWNGNASAASRALGMDPAPGKLKKWLRLLECLRTGSPGSEKLSYPTLDGIGPCMDQLGVEPVIKKEVSASISNRIGVSIGSTVTNSISAGTLEQQLREKDIQIETLKEIIKMLGGPRV